MHNATHNETHTHVMDFRQMNVVYCIAFSIWWLNVGWLLLIASPILLQLLCTKRTVAVLCSRPYDDNFDGFHKKN